jgi:hypothetical protein
MAKLKSPDKNRSGIKYFCKMVMQTHDWGMIDIRPHLLHFSAFMIVQAEVFFPTQIDGSVILNAIVRWSITARSMYR